LEQAKEREWKSILCPEKKIRTMLMCEWDVESKGGRILNRRLKQIDCSNPQLTEFGGVDCQWGCEDVIGKREK
jgi:hypothetical protein